MEEWREVVGFEGIYQVSSLGNIRSKNTDCKKTKPNNRGYIQICFSVNGRQTYKLLHRVVAEAFIDNPNNLPQVNHKDEDKNNNRVDNLEWCTNLYNRHYGTGYQRSVQNHNYKAINAIHRVSVEQICLKTGAILKVWDSIKDAVSTLGVHQSSVSMCCLGRGKSAGGYGWRYTA